MKLGILLIKIDGHPYFELFGLQKVQNTWQQMHSGLLFDSVPDALDAALAFSQLLEDEFVPWEILAL